MWYRFMFLLHARIPWESGNVWKCWRSVWGQGRVCPSVSMCESLWVCVCVNGWAGIRSFSPHKTWDRSIKKSLVMWNLAKSNYNTFPLVRWVDFLVNLTQLVMHISFFFLCFVVDQVQVLRMNLSVWLRFLGTKQVGSCDEWRKMVSMQQLGVECSFNSLFFTSTLQLIPSIIVCASTRQMRQRNRSVQGNSFAISQYELICKTTL